MMSNNPTDENRRSIRSYVLRQGHLSDSQANAITAGMPKWGIPFGEIIVDPEAIFGRNAPVIVEIGFGMGTATAQIAQSLPEKDFIAIEVHSPGVGNLLKLIEEQQLRNIRVVQYDAVEVIIKMIADESLAGIHIYFPDPWHKKRHHKRRLIQLPFIEQLVPKLKKGGYLHLATDWADYAEQMLAVLDQHAELENTAQTYATKPDYRPETKFEARGLRLGHGIWDIVFKREG